MGMSAEAFYRVSQLEPQELADPDNLVDYECLIRVWTELIAQHGEQPLGVRYADLITFEVLGVVGYVVRHSSTPRQALEAYLRFSRLADPHIEVSVSEREDQVEVALGHEDRVEALVEPIEMMVLAAVRLMRESVDSRIEPIEVCFRHARRHPEELYRPSIGQTATLRFNAQFTGSVWRQSDFNRPIVGADPRMATYLVHHAERSLAELPEDALEQRARRAIDERLVAGEADQKHVAKALGMSVRSLQRALRDCGTTFSTLLDQARRNRAELLLSRPELSASEIAFMLGYSDPRAFFRSFRRWTGTSPSEYRRERSHC